MNKIQPEGKRGWDRLTSMIALLVLSGLAVLFSATGAELTELLTWQKSSPDRFAANRDGAPDLERGFWQVYFTESIQ